MEVWFGGVFLFNGVIFVLPSQKTRLTPPGKVGKMMFSLDLGAKLVLGEGMFSGEYPL